MAKLTDKELTQKEEASILEIADKQIHRLITLLQNIKSTKIVLLSLPNQIQKVAAFVFLLQMNNVSLIFLYDFQISLVLFVQIIFLEVL